jgi:rhodanese-related sulfurtransferase
MHELLIFFALVVQLSLFPSYLSANEGFPGRAEYPEVTVYDMKKLQKNIDQVVIVDTRSSYEYSTLNIKGAVNIPVAAKNFEERLAKLRCQTNKPIVFYCIGRTCYKSYHAVKKASKAKIDNTYAYDAGVLEWAQANPDRAVLLGKSPMNPKDIIPKSAFKSRCLEPELFSNKIYDMGSQSLVIDVRDKYQRGSSASYFPGKERWASLDTPEKLMKYIDRAKQENRTLFIYDEVGKQARWVQYALQDANFDNYFFMEKGARN